MNDIALVYLAAGISSRFGGKLKQFAKVGPNGETLIEYSLKQALIAGFTKIIFIVGDKTEKPFREMFGDSYEGIPVYYALQAFDVSKRDKPWGTVAAVCAAKDLIDCPFVLSNSDDISGSAAYKMLVDHLKENKSSATVASKLIDTIPEEGTVNRGIFRVDENLYVKEIDEVLGFSRSDLVERGLSDDDFVNANLFALSPDVVSYLSEIFDGFVKANLGDRKIECLLPVELSGLIKQDVISMKVYPAVHSFIGITNPEDEEIVREKLKSISF